MNDISRDLLVGLLKKNVLVVSFTKKDGSLREMQCTLKPDLIEQVVKEESDTAVAPVARKENLEVLSVWDLEAKGWRSFRLDSILMVGLKLNDGSVEYVG